MAERGREPRPPYIAVIGDGEPRGPDAHRILDWAEEIGLELARAGATVITGGLGGVMEAASRGARAGAGRTIGFLPGADAAEANDYVSIPIATGLGVMRNLVVVTSADAVVAVGGRHGTLSEIGLALQDGTPRRHPELVARRVGAPARRPESSPCARSSRSGDPGTQARHGGCPGSRLRLLNEATLGELVELRRVVRHFNRTATRDLPGPADDLDGETT